MDNRCLCSSSYEGTMFEVGGEGEVDCRLIYRITSSLRLCIHCFDFYFSLLI